MRPGLAVVTGLLVPVAAIACAPGVADRDAGRSQHFAGTVTSGFEVEAFSRCTRSRSACVAAIGTRDTESCWVDYTPAAAKHVREALVGMHRDYRGYVTYWIEFTGMIEKTPDGSGHLGAYPCRVLVEDVREFSKVRASAD